MTRAFVLVALLILLVVTVNDYAYPCKPGTIMVDASGQMWACATAATWRQR